MCKLNNFLVHCDCLNNSYKNNNYFAEVQKTTAIMSYITAVGYEDSLCIEGAYSSSGGSWSRSCSSMKLCM